MKYYPPSYISYTGGFADVTKCRECGIVGLYEDCHPVNPCYWCGGEVDEIGAGKWIKRVRKFDWNSFTFKTISPAFWADKNGNKL